MGEEAKPMRDDQPSGQYPHIAGNVARRLAMANATATNIERRRQHEADVVAFMQELSLKLYQADQLALGRYLTGASGGILLDKKDRESGRYIPPKKS